MSYLEGYAERDARRRKVFRLAAISLVIVAILGVVLFYALRDRAQKQAVESFLERLRAADYQGAYSVWGCTEATPCRGYPFESFMEDWGPKSPQSDVRTARIADGQHCEEGRIVVLQFPDRHEVQLRVERSNNSIGFAPWPIDFAAGRRDVRGRLRLWMRDLAGDCAPPARKVP